MYTMKRLYKNINQGYLLQLLLVLLNGVIFIAPVNASLSAKSAKTIQGHPPRFNTTYETIIQNEQNFELLGITYSGVNYFDSATFTSKLATSGLTYMNNKPVDITVTPVRKAATIVHAASSDGDTFGPDSLIEKATGSVTANWYYRNTSGNEYALTATQKSQTFCALAIAGVNPYIKVSGPVTLKTMYGDPDSQDYPDPALSITKNPQNKFNIELNNSNSVCYASPDISYAKGVYDPGTPLKFNPAAGFIPQLTAANNFPTTGSDGLFFNLVVAGVDVQAPGIIWSATSTPSTSNVTATVVAEKSILTSTANLVYRPQTMVKVTLRGPVASSFEIGATAPKFTATTIKVTGTDTSVTPHRIVASYQFQIKSWYVTRSNLNGEVTAQTAWCSGLGSYRIPTVSELTTATGKGWTGITSTNNYQRISGSLFGEWGAVYAYGKTYGGIAELYGTWYMTSNSFNSSPMVVDNAGAIAAYSSTLKAAVACRSL